MNAAVFRLAVGLPDSAAVDFMLGGAASSLSVVADAAPATLVIGVDGTDDACAVAVLTGDGGARVDLIGRIDGGLPMRVRAVGEAALHTYPDPRVERVIGWSKAVAALAVAGESPFICGIPHGEAKRLGRFHEAVRSNGAAAPLAALAQMLSTRQPGTLLALDGGAGTSAQVGLGDVRCSEEVRTPLPADACPRKRAGDAEISFSMPAYSRALEGKIGLRAGRCVCGELSYPARVHCLSCGRQDMTSPYQLARTAEVYSVVAVHTDLPGIETPYALAIITIDESGVRLLAKVTDAFPAQCAIGDRGRLVLRRIAVREGIPDYNYAFQPDDATREDAGPRTHQQVGTGPVESEKA
jgi:uncharacterized OB-fold protein